MDSINGDRPTINPKLVVRKCGCCAPDRDRDLPLSDWIAVGAKLHLIRRSRGLGVHPHMKSALGGGLRANADADEVAWLLEYRFPRLQ